MYQQQVQSNLHLKVMRTIKESTRPAFNPKGCFILQPNNCLKNGHDCEAHAQSGNVLSISLPGI